MVAAGETSGFARPGKQVSDPLALRATVLDARHCVSRSGSNPKPMNIAFLYVDA
jgi:hypothetical protein